MGWFTADKEPKEEKKENDGKVSAYPETGFCKIIDKEALPDESDAQSMYEKMKGMQSDKMVVMALQSIKEDEHKHAEMLKEMKKKFCS